MAIDLTKPLYQALKNMLINIRVIINWEKDEELILLRNGQEQQTPML